MELVLIWLLFGIAAALIAQARGRSGCGWFLLGVLFGPFSLVVAFLPSWDQRMQNRALHYGQAGPYRKCPHCAELVRLEALKCKHCGSPLTLNSPDIPATKRCSQCAYLNSENAAFCAKCGHKFSW